MRKGKYPETTDALIEWSKWFCKRLDGRELWTPESILSVVMQYGLVPDSTFSSKELAKGKIAPEPVRTHAVIAKMGQHRPDLARVVVCHYVMPGDVKDKRRTYFNQSQTWYDKTLEAAKAWLDGARIGNLAT